jgi:arylformamidase
MKGPASLALLLALSLPVASSAQQRLLRPSDIDTLSAKPATARIAYGPDSLQFGDLRLPDTPGPHPVVIVIHGGCWVSRFANIRNSTALADALRDAGFATWNVEYRRTDSPGGGWPNTFLDVARATDHLRELAKRYPLDLTRTVAVGHSAGGHLAAMMLACVWPAFARDLPAGLVKNAMSISGLHDLEPIRHTPFLADVKLTPQQVRQGSPALLPAPAQGTLAAVSGGDESEEFHRQMRLIRDAWGKEVVPVCETLPGLNHFSVLEALMQPAHRLHQLALALLGK